ncbi:MAG TPA: hypothetical protein P5141_02800 [Candidatus Hydrogenedentes bacterium]|nr:hypothetical protein [Candidatus Hydrogenedentota bacterium]
MRLLPPSNSWARGLAQEWLEELYRWFEANGTAGYDPFDLKAHPLFRRLQARKWPRRASTVLGDLFPVLLRKCLGVPPTENPKTHALLALGKLRLYQRHIRKEWLEEAERHLEWLTGRSAPGFHGMCWGYPFDVTAAGMNTPAGTPVLVVSAIAGQAYHLAWEITGRQTHRDAVLSIAEFIRNDLPRMEDPDGRFCFGYTPQDRRRVHNANLLAVEHLARAVTAGAPEAWFGGALPALAFTLAAQREDGAFPYGTWRAGDPHEPGLLSMVDHHHTGFVLRSLHALNTLRPGADTGSALDLGWIYYRNRLLLPSGMPVGATGRYPVDIHACAEAVLCPSALAERYRDAQLPAALAMRWAWAHLRDPRSGGPWYREYPGFRSKIVYPRWGAAWMFRALAEFDFRFDTPPY